MKRYGESLSDLNTSLEIEPNNAEALRIRGETCHNMNKYEESLADLNKSLKIEPNNADALRIRGETYRKMNRYGESLSDLNISLEIEPNNAGGLRIRGETYRMMNRYEESLADLNKSLEIEPNHAEALSNCGETYRMMNRYEESLADLNKSLEIEPNNAVALRIRGEIYRIMKRYEASLPDLNKSLEIEPNHAEALSNRGETYRMMNRYEEALADLNKSLEINPYNAEALRNRVATYYALTRYEESHKDLVRYKSLEGCMNCRYYNTSKTWCRLCDPKRIIRGWSSENKEIDECVKKFQIKATKYEKLIEWIPFDKLVGLQIIGKGGFGTIYSATWLDGKPIIKNNLQARDQSCKVALKTLSTLKEREYLINQCKTMMKSFVTDLGLSKSLKESASKGEIYGVMPYIAPEILLGEEYTQAADIYSLGIIMTELSTGKRPFHGSPFNSGLALNICNGLRPGFSEKTPKCYIELANQCMDSNPRNRPSAKDISSKFSKWRMILMMPWISNNEESDIKRSFISANEEIKTTQIIFPNLQNSLYTSRLINTKEIKLTYESYESAKFRGNFN
ncbi:hypothetical protein C2G38_2298816 [Gigaspora rosea]|uniref:Protein kinase domain-containing protein n=1 Tax=Gigaspora rosea TaxID=44941 RepID=A0A397VGU4_9GLOM|nr:hypothetical protein C2G38_2298816 [Gigaspora rosea]